jgi:large subunit ribosomal protein L23
MNQDKTLVLKPRVSEKAYAKSQDNVYVFKVDKAANKNVISAAVEAQFGVTVMSIKTLVQKGKAKRTIRKGGRPVAGRESDFKKAYITLKDGDSIPVFNAEESTSAEATAEKESKPKTEKKAEADKKPAKKRFGRSK